MAAVRHIRKGITTPHKESNNIKHVSVVATARGKPRVRIYLAEDANAWMKVQKLKLPNLSFPTSDTSSSVGHIKDIRVE